MKPTLTALVLCVACLAGHAQERIIQKASQADVTGGTNDTRYITPLKLATAISGGPTAGALTNNEARAVTLDNGLTVRGVTASTNISGQWFFSTNGGVQLWSAAKTIQLTPNHIATTNGPNWTETTNGTISASGAITGGSIASGGTITAGGVISGNGAGLTNLPLPTLKSPFHTNYTADLADNVIACTGTNQLITLPNITNTVPAGKIFTFLMSSTTGYGSAIVTNANGAQTILTAAGLSQTITNGQSLTLICDGANWR